MSDLFKDIKFFLLKKFSVLGGNNLLFKLLLYHYYLCFAILHQPSQFWHNKNVTARLY